MFWYTAAMHAAMLAWYRTHFQHAGFGADCLPATPASKNNMIMWYVPEPGTTVCVRY